MPKDMIFNFMLALLLKVVLLQLKHNMRNAKWNTSAVSTHAEEATIFFYFLAKSQIVKQATLVCNIKNIN